MTENETPETGTPAPDAPPPSGVSNKSLHGRMYNWVMHWAYTPYAQPALVLLSFAESSFFPIPPDVLLLPLCLGEPKKAYRFALWCSIASVLGGAAGYALGHFFWNVGLDQICFDWIPGFTPEVFEKVGLRYDQWNFWLVFTAGFTPIPYKVITITAGVFGINFPVFLIASAVSRSARFFIEAALLKRYGHPIRDFIEKRLGLMALLFCVILVGGFALVKYVF